MGSLIFVHGIAVREPHDGSEHPYDATCRAISQELSFQEIDWTLVRCRWGDDLGARLLGQGVSFPRERARIGTSPQPDDPADFWAMLLDDPTFELRVLAALSNETTRTTPGASHPNGLDLQNRLRAGFEPTEKLELQLARFELEEFFAAAVKQVQNHAATASASKHPQASRAIARAIVARTIRIALRRGVPAPSLFDVEVLSAETERSLHGVEPTGAGDWTKRTLLGLGAALGERRRAALSQPAAPIAGDIVLYQVHGDLIRRRIADVVANAAEPVAILGHSLGGVAAAEALCEDATTRKRVSKFVTAGSQPGFFYEINALRTLPFGTSLPEDFPNWLNFWDSHDLLSFVVEPVFAGGRQRTDVQVESGLPFPASHSGYWRQSKTWETLKAFLVE
jgi:hypothetical protein